MTGSAPQLSWSDLPGTRAGVWVAEALPLQTMVSVATRSSDRCASL